MMRLSGHEEQAPVYPSLPRVEETPENRLEDYLDHVTADLVGVVPYAQRQEFRREVRSHILSLAEAYEELGQEPSQALTEALKQFGPPQPIARQWVAEWEPYGRRFHTLEACKKALPWLGIPTLGLWMITFRDPLWCVSAARGVLDVAVVTPLLFGFLAGWRGQRSRASGTCVALLLLAMATGALAGLVHAERIRGSLAMLSVIQFLAWAPLGTLAAGLAGWLREGTKPRPRIAG